MVMVKRIRKSNNEIWTITVYGELNGEMVEGPALKLENLNPNDLTPHFENLAPYIVIQWLYSMVNIRQSSVEVISCKLQQLICGFTKFTPVDFENSGVSFLTVVELLCSNVLPCVTSSETALPVYPSNIIVELKSQNGDIYELQAIWSDIKQALKACDIIL